MKKLKGSKYYITCFDHQPASTNVPSHSIGPDPQIHLPPFQEPPMELQLQLGQYLQEAKLVTVALVGASTQDVNGSVPVPLQE